MELSLNIEKRYILLKPETSFEEQTLVQSFSCVSHEEDAKVFIKTGVIPADVVGLKICFPTKKDSEKPSSYQTELETDGNLTSMQKKIIWNWHAQLDEKPSKNDVAGLLKALNIKDKPSTTNHKKGVKNA